MVKRTSFDIVNNFLMILILAVFIYPLVYITSVSISDPKAITNGLVKLWPVGFQVDAYKLLLGHTSLWQGYLNNILYSGSGALLTIILSSLAGYVLMIKEFKPRKYFITFFAVTMFFSGGMIPSYILINKLGLMDSLFAIIIYPSLSAWYIILFRTNFKEIPESLIESAEIDGASHVWIYSRLVLPLSKAIIAVIAIYSIVGIWNSYFPALLYLSTYEKMPLMIMVRKIVIIGNFRGDIEYAMASAQAKYNVIGFERSVKMATMVVTILPVVFIYPAFMRYMVKGVMVGSLKE